MALSESALSELLEALRAGEAMDVIRESVRMVLQEFIEAEATEVVGAAEKCASTERGCWSAYRDAPESAPRVPWQPNSLGSA